MAKILETGLSKTNSVATLKDRAILRDVNSLVTIVIPTKNEEAAIEKVIDELHYDGFTNILVVDGFSTDKTVELAKAKGVKVIYQLGKGKSGAIKTAIDHIDTPYLVLIDGDHTYYTSDIYKVLEHAEEYGEVIGYRILKINKNISMSHFIGNKILTAIFNLMFGVSLSDICSGLFVIKTDIAKRLRFESQGFDVEVEIAAQIASMDKVYDVPIEYRPRLGGRSKLSTWRAGFLILSSILRFGRKYKPRRFYSLIALLPISIALISQNSIILDFLGLLG